MRPNRLNKKEKTENKIKQNKNKLLKKVNSFSMRTVIIIGVVLLVAVTVLAAYAQTGYTESMARDTMETLKQQCLSYNKLTAADRTKSLFRLIELMQDFVLHSEANPEMCTDEYLEEHVKNLRISGIAVLDETLTLEASGYTRQYRSEDWKETDDGVQISDVFNHPEKIYAERRYVHGDYYDMCAVARKDKKGVVVGFYRQPSGLITNTESDLKSLLSGIELDRGGHYVVAENGMVRVTGDKTMVGRTVTESPILNRISKIPKDDSLHVVRANGRHYLGIRSGCEEFSIYIYYPFSRVFVTAGLISAVFVALYALFVLIVLTVREKSLYEKQNELEKSNKSLMQTVRMLQALETLYFSLFYVDLETDRYETIYVARWLKPIIPERGSYVELREMFVSNMVLPEFKEEIRQKMSDEYIRDALSFENITDVRKSYYTDYKAIRDDKTPWCRVTATPVDYDDNGKPRHILALIQDIDKEKKIEAGYQARILKEANDAKIANIAKSEFLRRISHDIRTPINGVRGYIELASKHPDDLEYQAHCREKATVALDTLFELVNGVVEMSKLESSDVVVKEQPISLTEILDDVNTVITPQAIKKGVNYEIVRKGPVAVDNLLGSKRLVTQIIQNIVANAVKFTNPGGYVRVDTKLFEKTEDTVTYDFVIADNGIGMSEEFQQHMYETFTQEAKGARTTYEGEGLGLSIVKKLVDALNGSITCKSAKGEGTEFCVRLTFKINKQKTENIPQPEGEPECIRNRNVLLVEDNELNMEIAECLLAEHGAKVTKAWNGKEAVDAFAASPEGEFDIVLLDIMMPEMDGLEATRKIRAMNRPDAKSVPIVAMSANSFPDDVKRSIEAGMNAHLAKPIEPNELFEVLKKYLKH